MPTKWLLRYAAQLRCPHSGAVVIPGTESCLGVSETTLRAKAKRHIGGHEVKTIIRNTELFAILILYYRILIIFAETIPEDENRVA